MGAYVSDEVDAAAVTKVVILDGMDVRGSTVQSHAILSLCEQRGPQRPQGPSAGRPLLHDWSPPPSGSAAQHIIQGLLGELVTLLQSGDYVLQVLCAWLAFAPQPQ